MSFGLCMQAIARFMVAGILFLSVPASVLALTPVQGDRIVNRASFRSNELPTISSSVTVTITARTWSTIEFLKFAPGATNATVYKVPTTRHRNAAGAFTDVPAPVPFGLQTPIDLTLPVPLLVTTIFHSGEPLFIKTTDPDQNLDRNVSETIIVTITDPKTGDNETLRLTESGPDSGTFIGYIPTETAGAGKPTINDSGRLSVAESSSVRARYIDIYDGSDDSVDAALVDPFGIVFDTVTGRPVDGATIELIDATTGLGAVVLGDNGIATNIYPNTVVSGGTASDADGNIYSFPPGSYRFPFVTPGDYILRVTPPPTHSSPSTVPTAQIQTLPGAPFAILQPGSRGEVFAVPAGPAIRVDIPVDPKIETLWLRKTAGKTVVSAGEFLSYDISLENGDAAGSLFSTVITDKLPPGFRYRTGSTRIDGRRAADPVVSADGSTMTFTIGTIGPGSTINIRYVVSVGANAKPGQAINTATAATTPPVSVSAAKAVVQVQEPFMMSRSIIMGRVVVGACSDNPDGTKKGLEGIGIYLEDGTFVITDKFGMFHFEGVRPGVHVVQLDLDSIPEGYRVLPCEQNSRFAGRAYSQFVDMQGGTMWRADFHLGRVELAVPTPETVGGTPEEIGTAAEIETGPPAPEKALTPPVPVERFVVTPFKGELSLEMMSSRNDDTIDYRLPLQAHTVPLKRLRMAVVLPEGVKYVTGSSSFNGVPLPDPEMAPEGLIYHLEDATDKWVRELQFRGVIDRTRKAGDLVTRAFLKFDTEIATDIVTPEVSNVLTITTEEKILPLPLFVFHPHFPTFGDTLSEEDRRELDALAAGLVDKIVTRIDVTGHTDNVRIAPRSRGIHADNRALSLARARSVGRHLATALKLPPEAIFLNGSGGKEPVATNRTAVGRALNRRVEVKVTAMERIEVTDLKITRERSGLEKLETTGAPKIEKVEGPVILQPVFPVDLNFTELSIDNGAESGDVEKEAGGEAAPSTEQPPTDGAPQPEPSAPIATGGERVELVSVILDGVVHYRIALKGVNQPLRTVSVALSIPGSLLYMNNSSQLLDGPTADPEVEEATLRYDFNKLGNRKKFDLRLQALFDGDVASDDHASRVTIVITDEQGAVRTLTATSLFSDNAVELTRPETEAETVAPRAEVVPAAAPSTPVESGESYQERPAPPAGAKLVTPENKAALRVTEKEGFISHSEGSVIATRINSVRVVLAASLKPVLLLDGSEVPSDRIGFSIKDGQSGKNLYAYIGVDFGETGDHTLQLQGLDTFGVVRFSKSITVTRTGEIAEIRLVTADGNVADGRTPVRVRVQLVDVHGKPVMADAELAVMGGDLQPWAPGRFGHDSNKKIAAVNADGWIEFHPVTASGLYRTQLAFNKATLDIETYVKPKMRDWILVGIAEGTVGYNMISGHMENLQSADANENLYDQERLALFAKGTIKGEWLLTMAYDSAGRRTGSADNALFQTIDPNAFYTLYGDATAQGYEAASRRKLYLKIERDQFYALFGDYDTGLTVTELSRYSRRMNGLKSEYRSENLEVSMFGSQTGQSFVKDEIRGDGTSGLYRLSRREIIPNSESIAIESRDRFHSETVTEHQALNRFIDYSIDYETGTIFFKSPVPSRDEKLDPVYIVVDYEIADAGTEALTYGGRAATRLLDGKIRLGGTYVREGHISGDNDLFGADALVVLAPGAKARVEIATTNTTSTPVKTGGNAYLAELAHSDNTTEAKAYFREQQNGFGLGQQKGSESGTRKFGAEGAYRPKTDSLLFSGQAYRQYNLAGGSIRDFVEGLATYTDKRAGAHAGLRYANDTLADGSSKSSLLGIAGGSWKGLGQRLTLRADHEQALLSKNSNADFPTRTILGAEYQATATALLFVQEEVTYGAAADTNTTRAGIKATPWNGGAMSTSVVNEMKESNDRTFANVGLSQKWQVTPLWSVDGGIDHNRTIRKKAGYQFDADVPPASGGEDFTAVSLGANYTEKRLAWSNRFEFRDSDLNDKWGLISGVINEQGLNWGWTSRLQLMHDQSAASSRTDADLRMGLAYRPPVTRWIVLDRLDLIISDEKNSGAALTSKRIINNLNANYRPDSRTQISVQYGAKYVVETFDSTEYSGYTDLIGIEGRHDLSTTWDLGLRVSLLHSWGTEQYRYSGGPSIGCNIMENIWISIGYNLAGFSDRDFSAADYTAHGPYVQFRFKFDQHSVKEALTMMNR